MLSLFAVQDSSTAYYSSDRQGQPPHLRSETFLPEVRTLFREYQESLNVDLGFQGFEEELATLPKPYEAPNGILFIAYWGGLAAGCVGVKPLHDDVCELKRLYVRQAYRGHGIGRALCECTIALAQNMGYRWMRLDTLGRLLSAIRLYEDLGFVEIESYYDNPLPEKVLFMERALDPPYRDSQPGEISTGPNPPDRPRSR